jgi:hypothetical protein
MRRNGIKNVLLANGTSAVIWQKKDADGYFGL